MAIPFSRYEPLFDVFARRGHELWFVGGCVRDSVMGVTEESDVDLTTDARPDAIEATLRAGGFSTFPLGARFGTIATMVGETQVEITTYRRAERYADGSRHPEVEFGDRLEDDLGRRDLSMNAMAMGRDGAIVDPYDGRRAIARGVLEVPGGGYENTISILRDDPLRLLRIARFAARFDFDPTVDTTRAAAATAHHLSEISHERWKMELDKLFAARVAPKGWRWLVGVGALPVLFERLASVDQTPVTRALGRVAGDVGLGWAVVALAGAFATDDAGPPCLDDAPSRWPSVSTRREHANELSRRFRFSNDERAALRAAVSVDQSLSALRGDVDELALRRRFAEWGDNVYVHLRLVAALSNADDADEVVGARADAVQAMVEAGDPRPDLPKGLGSALMSAASLRPGPAIGEAIDLVKSAVIDGELPNGASAETYVAWFMSRSASDAD